MSPGSRQFASEVIQGPHYRSNPLGAPVIVAASRRARPHDSLRHSAETDAGEPVIFDPRCPFCPGNEHMTPPEIEADHPADEPQERQPDTPGWTARVVPNKFPALVDEHQDITRIGTAPFAWPARGAHEVAVHSPDHSANLARIEPDALARTITMWQRRLRAHRAADWLASTLVINDGREAGASLAHPHAQIFATDIVPPALAGELVRQETWHAESGRCILRDVVSAERDDARVIDTEASLVAWVPYWASVPHEIWITNPDSDSDTGNFADSPSTYALARLLSRVARRLRIGADDPAYNVVLRDPPHTGSEVTWWHLRIMPRSAIAAGFELGTSIQIVPMLPEAAAADLRGAL